MSDPKPEDGCVWVEKGQLLQPSDFFLNNINGRVTAGVTGDSWKTCEDQHLWQRPRRQHPDIPFIKSRTLHATDGLPQLEQRKAIFEVYELTQQYADALTAIHERLDAMREGK